MCVPRLWLVLAFFFAFSLRSATPSLAQVSACAPSAQAATGEQALEIEVDGLVRRYLLYVPPSLDLTQPSPLLFSLHGFTSNMRQQKAWDDYDRLADENGFIVVWGQGEGVPPRWNAGSARFAVEDDLMDMRYIETLIDHLSRVYCVDAARIYASGFSNGGGMAYRLACQMADRIAAIATMSGAFAPLDCQPSRPVPVLAVHGTTDPVVRYNGMISPVGSTPGVEAWVAAWAERNGCQSGPISTPGSTPQTTVIAYTDCDNEANVQLYRVEGGGHTWFGSQPRDQYPAFVVGNHVTDLDASAIMWAFFSQHSLPQD
ncbi:MAG: hypothetical protein NZ750_04975 [Anaerolineae bacterium]|nr:hypothetical protein [Anaerolineae bacterium]MDW8172130.1 PHB depolymerase family esterase [Anaerolineae bacterium]